ncbi:lysophospholipid acyltransferase family protein [Mycoplasmopsis primatum]|uniref:lysophospholipid acyltransferase family protein n=1 Tax=Mycoplasmopsis primatum TaxID=55604 RepID=UPI0004974AD3|nr:lysophospholipid acyltransferase family protein [Mycoplasmopsis primatum]
MFIVKMIFFWWIFLWHMWRINAYARRYRKDPSFYHPQQRNDWLVKKAKIFMWFYGVKVKVEGYDNLPKGASILAPNHKSFIDPVVVLYALQKQTKEEGVKNRIPTFIAKKELTKRMLLRNLLSIIDTLYIDRDNIRESFKVLNEFGSFVKKNLTCGVIFPEGQRVYEDGLGEFKNGAFKVAISNYLPIVPVAITDTRGALNAKRFKKFYITIKFLQPLKPASFLTMNPEVISNKVKSAIEGALKNE